jgi:hypothetical protein
MSNPGSDRDQTHLLFPLFVASGIFIILVPILHPYGTCADWLVKWGDLFTHMKHWVLLHKFGMWGFALMAVCGFFFPVLGERTYASVMGGGCLGAGGLFMSMSTMIHATLSSSIGSAYNRTALPDRREVYRAVGEAFEAYDIGVTGGASLLVSGGIVLIAWALWRRRVVTPLMALVIAGLGSIWTGQYHGVFVRIGFSVPESIHWASLGVVLITIGLVTHLAHRRAMRAGDAAPSAPLPT